MIPLFTTFLRYHFSILIPISTYLTRFKEIDTCFHNIRKVSLMWLPYNDTFSYDNLKNDTFSYDDLTLY